MRNARIQKQAGCRWWRSEAEIEDIVVRYLESGLTQRVFAREEGIGVSTLQLWLRQCRTGSQEMERRADGVRSLSLLEVELADASRSATATATRYELELPSGARLRVGSDFAEADVRRLLGLLREVR
jgi:hypothetical protein